MRAGIGLGVLVLGLVLVGGCGQASTDSFQTPPASVAGSPGPDESKASAGVPTPSRARSGAVYVLGGVDADLGCSTRSPGVELVRLGVGLQQLAAMSIDPLAETSERREGGSLLGVMRTERRFTENEGFFPGAGFRRDSQGACKEAEQFGRVIGYEQAASLVDNDEYRNGGERSD